MRDICNIFVDKVGVKHCDALSLLRYLIAKKYIAVDISYLLENADFINVLSVNYLHRVTVNGNS